MSNLTFHASEHFTRQKRAAARGQYGFTVWLTGLSASGKSTIAVELEHQLVGRRRLAAYRLDGDNIRTGLNAGLTFGEKDRKENIRRIGEVAKLFADSGTIAITSFISPYEEDRQAVRKMHEASEVEKARGEVSLPFIEVHIDVDIKVAAARDPKGLYARAMKGEIPHFTGISPDAPYEAPKNPEIYIKNQDITVEEAAQKIIDYLEEKGLLHSPTFDYIREIEAKSERAVAEEVKAEEVKTEDVKTEEVKTEEAAPTAN